MKKMFIGGQWVVPHDERSLPVVSPADGEVFDQIAARQRGRCRCRSQGRTRWRSTARGGA